MRYFCATTLFAPGDQVEILDSGVVGTVVEIDPSPTDRHEHRYRVEYIDNCGNPQFTEWLESQLEPWSPDDDEEIPLPDRMSGERTVVDIDVYRRRRAA